MRPPINTPPSAPDVTDSPATLPVVRISEWLENIRSQAATYRKEDNGDKRHWSIYNQGRADALENVIEDVRRMLSNAEVSDQRGAGSLHWLGDGLMKTTKTITETKEVHVCDFCANGEHMACNPATCVVCGKEACCDCTHKRLVGMEIKRPHYWASQGTCPHPETLWACPDCNDELTRKIVALNKTVELAQKYMGDFVRSYCNTLDAIMREANRREKRREANAKQ